MTRKRLNVETVAGALGASRVLAGRGVDEAISALAWMRAQAKEIDGSVKGDESVGQCARIISSVIKIPKKREKCT